MSQVTMLAGFWDPISRTGIGQYLNWYQVPMIVLLIAIIIGWVMYRRKQM